MAQPDAFQEFYLSPYRVAGMPSHRVDEVSDQRHHIFDLFNRSVSNYPVEYLAACFLSVKLARYYGLFCVR
jgi:hypothetical protein